MHSKTISRNQTLLALFGLSSIATVYFNQWQGAVILIFLGKGALVVQKLLQEKHRKNLHFQRAAAAKKEYKLAQANLGNPEDPYNFLPLK